MHLIVDLRLLLLPLHRVGAVLYRLERFLCVCLADCGPCLVGKLKSLLFAFAIGLVVVFRPIMADLPSW